MSSATLLGHVRRHGRRAAWAVADQGAYPLMLLLLTPVLLAHLGRAGFGLWMLAVTIVSMSPLLSCGSAMAVTKHVSADLAVGAQAEAVAAIRAALLVAATGGLVAALLAWLSAPLVAASLFAQMGAPATTAPVLALCGLAAAVQEIDNVYAAALRGAERFDLCARVELPSRLAMLLVLGYLASRGSGVQPLLVALIVMMVGKAALKGLQVVTLLNCRACGLPSLARAPLQRLLSFGVWQWLQSAGSVLFAATDQLLIGGLLGAAALTRYSICLQIAQYVHWLPSVTLQIVFPRLSALGQNLDPRRGNDILRATTLAALAAAALLGAPLLLFGRPLLRAWIGADFADENQLLLAVLVLVHIALAGNIGAYFVLLGSGRPATSARIVLAAGAAQSIFAVVAAPFGILAVACNRFVYSCLTAFLYGAARYRVRER